MPDSLKRLQKKSGKREKKYYKDVSSLVDVDSANTLTSICEKIVCGGVYYIKFLV